MKKQELITNIYKKKSVLTIGLDTDFEAIPAHLQKLGLEKGIIAFNKQIIEATASHCVAYKINTAFYEQYGQIGWQLMAETLAFIPKDIFTIADAKRGDIGNTSKMYAKAFFDTLTFDAITVAPYMGSDSILPFLSYSEKWIIVLALTSNQGSNDLQNHLLANGKKVYEHSMEQTAKLGSDSNIMFVTGATKASSLQEIRNQFPNHFFLVPGVGAQGGSAQEVCKAAFIPNQAGLLINSSRGIIYASNLPNFAEKAKDAAKNINKETLHFF